MAKKDEELIASFAAGAILGGMAGGPPGALIGGFLGLLLGEESSKRGRR